ncbi:MAG: hypothetical protein MJ192_02830 [Clostridia bacterium]|nr:hypothetical protein [Clostridia bacterium]
MKFKKLLCLLLATLMVTVAFASCADSGEGEETAATEGGATEAATKDVIGEALDRIGEVDWGKDDFTIVYTNDVAGYEEEIYSEGYEAQNSVINDAVYDRNVMFAERCNLNLVLIGKPAGSVQTDINNEAKTGSGDLQMSTLHTSTTASLATSCVLYNFLNFEDVDFEAEWWDLGTLEFALDGKIFFMNGSWNIVDDDVTFVMMFNKKLFSEKQLASPYEKVRSLDWTLDYFLSQVDNAAWDSNGDGKMDGNDTYGFCSPNTIGNTFFYGAGLQYVINNREMDTPELALVDSQLDKAVEVLEKVRTLTLGKDAYIAPSGSEAVSKECFTSGRSLFYVEAASYLRALNKEMTDDYGVVPIPKYDKAQDQYRTWTHGIGSTFSIPTSVIKPELMGGIIETFCVLSHQKLTPAYHDNLLTQRNVRDAESSEMVTMIMRNRVYDMAIYFGELGMGDLFSSAAITSGGSFASSFAKIQKTFDRKINNIVKQLQKTDK